MKKKIITLAITATVLFTQCSKESSPAPAPTAPVADYAYTGANGPAPCTVQFLNASTNATSYNWDFGDNGISTAENPSHTFMNSGVYTVKLTAKGAGGSNQTTQTINIGAAYTKCFITSVTINSIPFTDGSGAGWDISSGPDVFIKIAKYNGPSAPMVVYDGTAKRISDMTLNMFPTTFTLATPIEVTDFDFGHLIQMWDYDTPDPDDLIGNTGYAAINSAKTTSNPYPTSISVSDDKQISVKVNYKWQ